MNMHIDLKTFFPSNPNAPFASYEEPSFLKAHSISWEEHAQGQSSANNPILRIEEVTSENFSEYACRCFLYSLERGLCEYREIATDDYAPLFSKGDAVCLETQPFDRWGDFAVVRIENEQGDIFCEIEGMLDFSTDQWATVSNPATCIQTTASISDYKSDETGHLFITVLTPIRHSSLKALRMPSEQAEAAMARFLTE